MTWLICFLSTTLIINFCNSDSKVKETEVLLLLYEFEALVKLQDSRVETLLEKALTLPGSDPKTFETMAGKYHFYR